MIFARRTLQQRLDELRLVLDKPAVDDLVHRLNKPGKDRLAIMWEMVVLHALSRQGSVQHEVPLATGRQPDLKFRSNTLSFVADVTSVSDAGVDEKNPYEEFSQRIEALKTRLGLKIGGTELTVHEREDRTGRGRRRVLRLPQLKRLGEFINGRIEPALREQLTAGRSVLRVEFDDDEAGLVLVIDPAKSPFNTGSYGAYAHPTIKDANPLYNALRAKAGQLRGASGLTGVIVGDGGTASIRVRQVGWNEVSSREIAREFLRQHSSVGFVLLITVQEERRSFMQIGPTNRTLHATLDVQHGFDRTVELEGVVRAMMGELPRPVQMPGNAARSARAGDYGWGHHGGGTMSGNKVKISSRELMELLAGRRTAQQTSAMHDWGLGARTADSPPIQNPFERALNEGRLPTAIRVVKTDENDSDDWLEFELGASDPAISPFR